MKLQTQGVGKSREGVEASFGRGGRSLRQAVGHALTGSLGALGERLQGNAWFARDESFQAPHVNRLREVLDRDRALIAANPELNEPEPRALAASPAVLAASPAVLAAAPAVPSSARPLPPPAGSAKPPLPVAAASTATPGCQEPIRTRTMARLLAGQGHPERALSIYDYLLARPGADESLRAEADALRAAHS